MKVFNITDASTAALRNQGMENLPFRVGEVVVKPGDSAVLRGTAKERSELHPLVKSGAAAIDELPAWYAAKRGLNVDGSPIPTVEAPVEESHPEE